jgi:solute carrier family 35 protein E2
MISWLILREQNGLYVQLSLLPIMTGLMLCSVYELSFTMTGFLAALGTNIAEWYVL